MLLPLETRNKVDNVVVAVAVIGSRFQVRQLLTDTLRE